MLVVTYHGIAPAASPVTVPPSRLEHDLDALAAAGYEFVSLARLAAWLQGSVPLPERAVAITFDDGYASVAALAWPILQARRVPATVFVIGGRLGLDNRWPGQPAWVPTMPLLDAGAVRALVASGAEIGGHSSSHPRLPELDTLALDEEMRVAADRLEQVAQAPVRYFAYPYGLCGTREVEAARARFDLAFGAACRPVRKSDDPHQIARLDAHDVHVAARLGLLGTRALGTYLGVRRRLRSLRTALR